jgi:polysaccharide deacetylase family protein (PEP-CTERM system associated)
VKLTPIVNAMSVDVEDYFQVSAFEKYILRDTWDSLQWRVEANTDRCMELFDEAGIKATFFILGCVAERYPALIKRIAEAGHEIASHGYSHIRVTDFTPDEFRQDIVTTKTILEDTSGQEVIGYRAPSYSIGRNNLWALDVLAETGHHYSSSIYPIRHDLYGMPEAPRFAFKVNGSRFVEVPVTTVQILGNKLPCGGGGYFRLLPYGWSKWALRRVNERDKQSGVFYFHPWEIDPNQPRQQVGMKSRFRHYTNLGRMEDRLRTLLAEFHWGRMDHVFLKANVA